MPDPHPRAFRAPAPLLAALLLAAPAAQAQTAGVAALFPWRAAVQTEDATARGSERLARLTLPPEVLEQTRADLSDVRLLDGAGNEVPFLIEPAPPGRYMLPRVLKTSSAPLSGAIRSIAYGAKTFRLAAGGADGRHG